jgi:phosphatidylinositol alpha-1,6-mannosyltransferase
MTDDKVGRPSFVIRRQQLDTFLNHDEMILFITRKHPPSVGGMQKLSYQLIQAISQQTATRVVAWGGSQAFLPIFLPYALIRAIFILTTRRDASLIHLGDPVLAPLGVVLKALFHRPVVVTVHGLDVTFPQPLYQWLIPRCLRRLDRLIVISAAAREACLCRGIPPERCTVIPVGIDEAAFHPPSPEEARRRLEARAGYPLGERALLLTVGRLVERKGVAWFVASVLPRLMAAWPDILYLVVGEGPQRTTIETAMQAKGLEGHVALLGQVDEPTLRAAYAAAQVFVMANVPVPGDMEGFGLVALEACAAGCCVVAADLEGIPDAIVPGENGFLVPPGDADGYVNTILPLLGDEQRRLTLGRQAQHFVREHYSWQHVAEQYLAVFREVSSSPSPVADGGGPGWGSSPADGGGLGGGQRR